MFKTLHARKYITEKECKYFKYSFLKASDMCKFYLLPKIHKRQENVPKPQSF